MKFNILTIFPEMVTEYSSKSILSRGQKAGVISITPVNIRDFAEGKHKQVDDTPYGGGAGMVMKPEPLYKALRSIDALSGKKQDTNSKKQIFSNFKSTISKKLGKGKNKKTILMSPRGKQFDQRMAEQFAQLDELTIICGRYEGVDQRVVDHMIDEEVSVGPYVLAGGELGALIITEAVSRLIPGVLGNEDSLKDETHNEGIEAEYPQYTKPSDFMGWTVPDVLLSGDHKRIEQWREEQSSQL